jgi:DNA-binding phage protein
MKIKLNKPTHAIIGAVRVSLKTRDEINRIAKAHGVSRQEIVRAILDEAISSVEVVSNINPK